MLSAVSFARLNVVTHKLYNELYNLVYHEQNSKLYFGHQNTYLEGSGWRYRTDILPLPSELPSSDLYKTYKLQPKVFGVDFDEVGEWNIHHVKKVIRLHHAKNGITTISWHMKNPIVEVNSSSTTLRGKTVHKILNSPEVQRKFFIKLDKLVQFFKDMSDVPFIFRPFHEHNGNWFWWGKGVSDTTDLEFSTLWRMTIDYLRKNGVQNILIAYSPSYLYPKHVWDMNYLSGYPGDEYVDILGVDFYFKLPKLLNSNLKKQLYSMKLHAWKEFLLKFQKLAVKKNKIVAITEIGNEGIEIEKFWTDFFAWPMQKESFIQLDPNHRPVNFAYAMLWRNAHELTSHFYAPFPGHRENENFMELLKKNFLQFL